MCVSDKLFTKISKEVSAKMNIVIRTKNLSVLSQNVEAEGELTVPQPEDLAAIIRPEAADPAALEEAVREALAADAALEAAASAEVVPAAAAADAVFK